MLGYLSLDIICSSKLTFFLELRSRKTVRFSEQICPRTNILAYFRAKWRLLFIYSARFRRIIVKYSARFRRIIVKYSARFRRIIVNYPCFAQYPKSSRKSSRCGPFGVENTQPRSQGLSSYRLGRDEMRDPGNEVGKHYEVPKPLFNP